MTISAQEPVLRVLDVGHGNAAILVHAGKVLIIDAGGGAIVVDALREMGVTRVDFVLISHADSDHVIGLQSLLEETSIEIGAVYLNSDSVKETKAWRSVIFEIDRRRTVGLHPALTTNETGAFNIGELTVEIAAPAPALAALGPGAGDANGRRITANSMSVVVRLLWQGSPVILFPGDLDGAGLGNALSNGARLAAPIVVFPHHGGRSGVDPAAFIREFCDAVMPRVVLFSIGRGKHGTPNPEVTKALRARGPVRLCCTQLSENCAPNLPRAPSQHLLQVVGRGQEKGYSCIRPMERVRPNPAWVATPG